MSGYLLRIWLVAAALAATSLFSFWYAVKAWAKNRAIVDTPTARIRSAAQGYVELGGLGLAPMDSKIKGPLTGMPCAWWRYKIEERCSPGRSRWSTVEGDTSEESFVLDDGTGQCLIDPRGAEVFPGATDVWYGSESWPEMHVPNGSGVFGWLVDRLVTGKYRYTEHRLEPRAHIYAIGSFRSLGGVAVDSPDAAVGDLLHAWKQDQAALLSRFDRNHDGTLCAEEWQQARAAARRQVEDSRAADTRPPSENVLADPMDGRAFLLAACDGASLAQHYRRRAQAAIGGFVAAAAALTWILTRV